MTMDEIRGKVARLRQAKANPEVKFWIDTMEEFAKRELMTSYNAQGEEAVRAMGVQKGFHMASVLDDIYQAFLDADAKSKIVKV